jgi:tyrosine-protein kinase Etk/Wzc
VSVARRTGGVLDSEIRILDLAEVLLRQWRVIALTLGVVLVGCAAVLMLSPARYDAQVVMVPAARGSTVPRAAFGDQMGGALLGQFIAGEPNSRLVESILTSRSLADSLEARLAVGDPEEADRVRTVVDRRTRLRTGADGSITISVWDVDPERAARVANAYPPMINAIAAQLGADAAAHKMEFFDRQMRLARVSLDRSEAALIAFQREEDLPEVQEQAARTLEVAVSLQEQVMAKEVEVAGLRRTLTPQNPRIQAEEANLAALRDQLRRLAAGASGGPDQVLVPLASSPQLRLTSARLLRDYAKDEQVYSALMSSLIEAQIDVQNDLPVVSVLDRAMVPRGPNRTRSQRTLLLAAVLGLAAGIAVAFAREYFSRARHDPSNRGFFIALGELRQDIATPLARAGTAAQERRP